MLVTLRSVKIFDLFMFESSISGYTCDYVDQDGGSYEMVRQSLNELGMFDDLIWDGVAQAAGAKVAIMCVTCSCSKEYVWPDLACIYCCA